MSKFSFRALLIGLVLTQQVWAQVPKWSTDPTDRFIHYVVQRGDTLHSVARRFLLEPNNVREIATASRIDHEDRIVPGMVLLIPRDAVKFTRSFAMIKGLACAQPILVDNTKSLAPGMLLHEGASLDIPTLCHVQLQLEDASILNLPGPAKATLRRLRNRVLETSTEVLVEVRDGQIGLQVNPERSKSVPFGVRSPLALMGVRGTQFRVGFSEELRTTKLEVLSSKVSVQGLADPSSTLVTQGMGVTVDAQGRASAPQKLLEPPVPVSNASQSTGLPLGFLAPAQATSMRLARYESVNGIYASEQTVLPMPSLNSLKYGKEPLYYEASSINAQGLEGPAQRYAVCAAQGQLLATGCNLVFSPPSMPTQHFGIVLYRQNGTDWELVGQRSLINSTTGLFSVRGLKPASYRWKLIFSIPQENGILVETEEVGEFQLRILDLG